MARIEARVARILSIRELVLNKGSNDGILVGMRFAILNSKGADITDPESGEVLGSVEVEKTLVKVVRVYERLSVARTFRTFHTPAGPWYNSLNVIGSMAKPPTTVVEDLKTDEQRLMDELDEEESYVKVGDLAVQISGDEYEDEG